MEDLGEPKENLVEFFRCVEQPSTTIAQRPDLFPPPSHGNLLASSSKYGYLFIASGTNILVFKLASLREKELSDVPSFIADFSPHGVSSIRSISLMLDDAALIIHVETGKMERANFLIAHVGSLARGKVVCLPSSEHAEGVSKLAVCISPQELDAEFKTTSQCIAILLETGAVELHTLTLDGPHSPSMRVDEATLSTAVPTCVALSPGDELLAVGTERGNVYLYETETASLKATIVAIESGWIPFSIDYIMSDAIFVSYACEGMVNHIVWTIGEEGGELAVKRNSPLGELCFASPPSLPPSEDGENTYAVEKTDIAHLPVMLCSPIVEWEICIVASSFSTDVEVIALNDDGVWENWKFDEGKSATLPTDAEDRDTKPIGIAFDFTNISSIESADPSAPRINPMPVLLTFTSDSILLPFMLIDDRPEASCEVIRQPSPVLPEQKVSQSVEITSLPGFPSATNGLSFHKRKTDEADVVPASIDQERKEKDVPVAMSATLPSTNKPFQTSDSKGFGSFHIDPAWEDNSLKVNSPSFGEMQIRQQSQSESESDGSSSENSDRESDEGSTTVSPDSDRDISDKQFLTGPFSGTSQFLSNFSFPEISEPQKSESSRNTAASSDFALGKGAMFPATKTQRQISTISSVPLPKFPQQPSLVEASAAFSEGKPIDSMRSIILEMREELDYNKSAEEETTRRIHASREAIMPHVQRASMALAETLQEMRVHFRDETSIRKDVLSAVKEVMKLSREYESICLELRIREEDGVSSTLQAEDRAMDVRLSKKETEVLKSISSIDERLNTERLRRDREVNPSELIQQIFSSLSLQGIRLRKVHNLLTALSQRMDNLDKGGRRSDLGLSMARLEKLSLSEKGTPSTAAKVSNYGHMFNDDVNKGSLVLRGLSEPDMSEEASDGSKAVRNVLRRLAMRGGRANICVQATRKAHTASQLSKNTNDLPLPGHAPKPFAATSDSSHGDSIPALLPEKEHVAMFNIKAPSSASSSSGSKQKGQTSFSSSSSVFRNEKTLPGVSQASANADNNNHAHKNTFVSTAQAIPVKGSSVANTDAKGSLFATLPPTGSNKRTLNSSLAAPEEKSVSSLFAALPPDQPPTAVPTGPVKETDNHPLSSVHGREAIRKKTSGKQAGTEFASLPPDDSEFEKGQDEAAASRSKPAMFSARPLDSESAKEKKLSPASANWERSQKRSVGDAKPVSERSMLESGAGFASLPPDESIKPQKSAGMAQFAQLPPDESATTQKPVGSAQLGIAQFASLPLDESASQQKSGEGGLFTALPPDENDTPQKPATGLFASLPPDNGAVKNGGTSSVLVSGAAMSAARESQLNPKERPISTQATTAGLFAEKLDLTGGGSLFASAPGAESEPKNTEGTTSIVGTNNASAAGTSSSLFATPALQADRTDRGNVFGGGLGMDTSAPPGDNVNSFGAASASAGGGLFGIQPQNTGAESTGGVFGQAQAQALPFGSSGQTFGNMNAQSGQGMQGTQSVGFGTPSSQPVTNSNFSGFGQTSPSFNQPVASFGSQSPFGVSAQFGSASPLGGSQFGAQSQLGGGAQFGTASQIGGGAQFGATSPLGAGFGATPQLGGFGTQTGADSGGFGSSVGGFSGTPTPKFGESSFGMGQQQQSFGAGFGASSGNAFGGGGVSPFGAVAGTGFGGQAGGGSGFAALSASQNQQFGAAGSGFGNNGAPVFGSNSGPPAFTSAAFSQRRV